MKQNDGEWVNLTCGKTGCVPKKTGVGASSEVLGTSAVFWVSCGARIFCRVGVTTSVKLRDTW